MESHSYHRPNLRSSPEARIVRAALLVREAADSLKDNAAQLPDSAPSVRLQRIATSLGEIVNSLELNAPAVKPGHERTSSGSSAGIDLTLLERSLGQMPNNSKRQLATAINLQVLETVITNWLRQLPIGSRIARQLYALRARVREQKAPVLNVEEDLPPSSGSASNGDEHIGSAACRAASEIATERMTGDAA